MVHSVKEKKNYYCGSFDIENVFFFFFEKLSLMEKFVALRKIPFGISQVKFMILLFKE